MEAQHFGFKSSTIHPQQISPTASTHSSALPWASQRPVVYTPVQGRPQAVPSLVPGSCSGDQAFAEDTHGGECFAEDIHGGEARFPDPLLKEVWEPDKETPALEC